MSTRARRLVPLLIGLALILPAVVPAPAAASSSDAEAMILKKMNYERTKRGLVALRLDTRLAAIARDRSEYQARTGDADHTQGSRNVFDFIQSAGIKWYGAGEIIAWNRYYPSVEDSAAAAIKGWLGSPAHRAIMLSKGYNYVGFGCAMNPDHRQALLDGRLPEGPGPHRRLGQVRGRRRSVRSSGGYVAVTIRWSGADTAPPGPDLRLALLPGPAARRWRRRGRRGPTTTATVRTIRWTRGTRLRRPRPGPRQGRQLGRLGRPSASSPDPARRGPSRARTLARPSARWRCRHPRAARSGRRRRTAACASSASAKRRHERRLGQRVEAVLPPQPEDAERSSRRGRSAARSGRRAGRRTGSAARSSPSAAWLPGRRPPRRSRSRTARAAASRSQTNGSSGARNATPGSARPGGTPSRISAVRRVQGRERLARDDSADREGPRPRPAISAPDCDELVPSLPPVPSRVGAVPNHSSAWPPRSQEAVRPVARQQLCRCCSSGGGRSASSSAGKSRSARS